jgi:GntR family transcriptional repressor for pyruvate dehydrogenase complex
VLAMGLPMTSRDGRVSRPGKIFAPLRVQSTVEQIVDQFLTAIALGEFGVGDRMPSERELAAQLEVGRTTVREAVSRLNALGILEVRRGRAGGSYVRDAWTSETASAAHRTLTADWPQLKLLLDLRSLVEGLVAATAAERVTAPHRRRIAEALAAHAAAKRPDETRSTDRELHLAITRAADNPYLLELRDDLAAAVGLRFGSDPYVDDPAITRRAARQHKELVAAIFSRDAQHSSAVARHHFLISVDAIESLRARTLPGTGNSRRPGRAETAPDRRPS